MAHITVPASPAIERYIVGATAQTEFAVTFPYFEPDDLVVTTWVDSVPTLLTYSPDPDAGQFNLAGNKVDGGFAGGTVVVGGDGLANCMVTILRSIAPERLTDFSYPSASIDIRSLNTDLDHVTAMIGDMRAFLSRTLHLPELSTADTLLPLPLPARRALLINATASGFTFSTYDPDTTVALAQQAVTSAQEALDKANSALALAMNAGVGSRKSWGPITLIAGVQRYPLPAAVAKAEDLDLVYGGVPQDPSQWDITDELGVGMTLTIIPAIVDTPDETQWKSGAVIRGMLVSGLTSGAIGNKVIEGRHMADDAVDLTGRIIAPGPADMYRLATDGAGRTIWRKNIGVVNALDYIADGATDHWPGIQAAANAAAALGHALLIPSGIYTLSQRIVTTAPMRIFGCGMGQTLLMWPAGAASSGIRITSDADSKFIEVGDIALVTAQMGGTALDLDFSGQVDYGTVQPGWTNILNRWSPRFSVEHVHMFGATGPATSGWDFGVLATAAIGGIIFNCSFEGWLSPITAPTSGSTAAYAFRGVNGTYQNGHPVEFRVGHSRVYYATYGVYAENCEGVYVDTCPMVACIAGVRFYSVIGHPFLSVHGCDTACYQYGVIGQKINDSVISGNLFYQRPDTPSIFAGVFLDGGQGNRVFGNTVRGKYNPSQLTNGIALACTDSIIFGNILISCETAIWLQTASARNRTSESDHYYDCTYTYVDNGTANVLV